MDNRTVNTKTQLREYRRSKVADLDLFCHITSVLRQEFAKGR